MNLVDEKDIAALKTGEQSRELAGLFDDRSARVFDVHAHLFRDDVRERSFAKAGRSAEQNMLENIVAFFRCFDQQFQPFADFSLAGEFTKHRRPQRNLEGGIGRGRL